MEALNTSAAGNVLVSVWGPSDGAGVGIDFGVGPFVRWGKPDFYLTSYASDLRLRWAKHVPVVLDGNDHGLAFDRTGRIVASGTYAGSMVIDDRLLVSDNPLDPTHANTFLASIGVPPADDHSAPEIIDHVPETLSYL